MEGQDVEIEEATAEERLKTLRKEIAKERRKMEDEREALELKKGCWEMKVV